MWHVALRWHHVAGNLGLLIGAAHVHAQDRAVTHVGRPEAIDLVSNVASYADVLRQHRVRTVAHGPEPISIVAAVTLVGEGAIVVGKDGLAIRVVQAPEHFAGQCADLVPRRPVSIGRDRLEVVIPHVAAVAGGVVKVSAARRIVVVPVNGTPPKVNKRKKAVLPAEKQLVESKQHVCKEASRTVVHSNAQHARGLIGRRGLAEPSSIVRRRIRLTTPMGSRHASGGRHPRAALRRISALWHPA